jgi:hypothetical protein
MDTQVKRTLPTGMRPEPATRRAFACRCGRPVFFPNSVCLACHTALGYDPDLRLLLPLEAVGKAGAYRAVGSGSRKAGRRHYRRCAHLAGPPACNWLIADADDVGRATGLCRCCRLTRTLPDLSQPENAGWWGKIELAKRRLVSSLIALQLPVASRLHEDPQHGLAFDLLRAAPGGPPVTTGHADGVITLDIEEADDATRERRRGLLHEPYRTLLGHLRHESGHYYWQRLVEPGAWLEPFRALFGDERADYAAALKQHYDAGPAPDWNTRHVSAYASAHPWEDWAETWAHYLHIVDIRDTARSFGLDGEQVELSFERFGPELLQDSGDPDAARFLELINDWMELTAVVNELARSMGVADFYPFVLSATAVRKLHFVHRVVRGETPPPAARGNDDCRPAA